MPTCFRATTGWFKRLGQASLDVCRLGVEFPRQLRRLLRELEDGELEVGVRPAAFEPLLGRFEQAVNRLIFGLLIAAFVNGLAILTLAYLDHPFGETAWVDALFLLGFVLVSIFEYSLPGVSFAPDGSSERSPFAYEGAG